jgi:hypothetical protein
VTKTDLQHWRRIVELDRGHLEWAGLRLPVFAVSSYLRLQPGRTTNSWRSPASARWSPTRDRRRKPASTRATRTAALDVRFAVTQLGRHVAAERAVVARPQRPAGSRPPRRVDPAPDSSPRGRDLAAGARRPRRRPGVRRRARPARPDPRRTRCGSRVVDRSDPRDDGRTSRRGSRRRSPPRW